MRKARKVEVEETSKGREWSAQALERLALIDISSFIVEYTINDAYIHTYYIHTVGMAHRVSPRKRLLANRKRTPIGHDQDMLLDYMYVCMYVAIFS
jgi:hypothetical protein